MLFPGTVLSGRYRLNQRIAAGGMGEVWSSTDVLLQRQVAVKALLPALVSDSEFITRFRTEARIMAALRHPGIVQVHDYGENTLVNDGHLDFLVMEFIEGESLSKRIKAAGKLGVADTLSILTQAAEALHIAHGAGIVHRDVKPSNLLIRPDGAVVLIDFGVARSAGVTSVTNSSAILGSPQYMAPEQATGGPISPATDIYALGAVAYCCLTGRPPFTGDNPIQVIAQLLHGTPANLPDEIPAPVAALVRRALDKDPSKRHPTAAAFAEATRAAQPAAAQPAAAGPAAGPAVGRPAVAAPPESPGVSPPQPGPVALSAPGPVALSAGSDAPAPPAAVPQPAPVALSPGSDAPAPPAAVPQSGPASVSSPGQAVLPGPVSSRGPASSPGPVSSRGPASSPGPVALPRPAVPAWPAVPPLPAVPPWPAVPQLGPAASLGPAADPRPVAPRADRGNRRLNVALAGAAGTVVLGLVALIAVLALRPDASPSEAQAATNRTIGPALGAGQGIDRTTKPTGKPTQTAAPTPAQTKPSPSVAAPLPATQSAAVPGTAPTAAAAPSSPAAAVPQPQPAQVPSCPHGYVCFWTGSNYTGDMGKLKDRNPNWSTFKHAACPGGTWSGCASSIYNNGDNCKAQLWTNINYQNTQGTPGLVLPRQTGVAQLASIPVGSVSWDHEIRSNNWICP